jgi:hypothetical protein
MLTRFEIGENQYHRDDIRAAGITSAGLAAISPA